MRWGGARPDDVEKAWFSVNPSLLFGITELDQGGLKGSLTRDFVTSDFHSRISFPLALENLIEAIFTKIRGDIFRDYRNFVFITGVEEKPNHSTAKKAWSSINHSLLSISLDLLLFSLLQRSNSCRSTVQLFLAPTLCSILSSYVVPQP
jgi:hypothetical protein